MWWAVFCSSKWSGPIDLLLSHLLKKKNKQNKQKQKQNKKAEGED